MKFNKHVAIIGTAFIMLTLNSCQKKEFSPAIPEGTRFSNIKLKGYTVDEMQVRVGPRSVLAGKVNEDISEQTFEVPFDPGQGLNRVVFYKADGSAPYATSQINFKTPNKDTTVRVFYDGKTFFQNPAFPVAASGKMLFRVIFKSTAIKYTGMVDLELHLGRTVTKVVINPKTQVKDTIVTTTITPAIAKKITNVKPTEFTDYVEVPGFANSNENDISFYAIYIRLPGTTNPLPYPTNNVNIDPYAVFYATPDYTGLVAIRDARILTSRPNKIIYFVEDKMPQFF